MSEEDLFCLPPPRGEMPTLPVDLREYAKESEPPDAAGEGFPTKEVDLREYIKESVRPEAPEEELPDLFTDGPEEITAEFALDAYLRERQKHVPRLRVTASQLSAKLLDNREGFITSLIDGVSSVETLLDIAGMPKAEALAVLCNLHARGVIAFD